ncbi:MULTISPECIES: hypothetical protein [Bacillus]|uniref:hypothetical protein n=1 Tax=Bacillus TaxID=1386 RepID=UPI0002D89E58|nr:hypothetical protein [Bacillus cereus group sp. N3]MBY7102121.1 hypothetical protein [Bacillus sp. 6YEL31]MBY7126082.1 hypothetical protein [Bacillus sp. 8YEL33]NKW96114.1 hypothetical protein [Bacillus toyonensis]HDR7365603.1 hypothetical protein [Bacillus toyonensis]
MEDVDVNAGTVTNVAAKRNRNVIVTSVVARKSRSVIAKNAIVNRKGINNKRVLYVLFYFMSLYSILN